MGLFEQPMQRVLISMSCDNCGITEDRTTDMSPLWSAIDLVLGSDRGWEHRWVQVPQGINRYEWVCSRACLEGVLQRYVDKVAPSQVESA